MGASLAHYLDNPSLRPQAGAGTVRRVGLAVADADDGIELEHPTQEGLGLADAPAHRQILEGVDQYEAVIPLNRPFNPPSTSRCSDISPDHRAALRASSA